MRPHHVYLLVATTVVAACAASERTDGASSDSATAASAITETWCLSPREATLLGIGTNTEAAVLSRLGPPVSRDSTTGEDDGGEYLVHVLRFTRITVFEDARGFGIVSVETRDPTVPLPRGVRLGDSISVALDSLGVPHHSRRLTSRGGEQRWEGPVCMSDTLTFPDPLATLEMHVDSTGRVTLFAVTNYGP